MLDDICNAFDSGYKYIILEAPAGFGKSPVAIAVALSLGSSYICTATKDLQTQYSKDFPYINVAKGKNNFPCLVKQDFIRNGTYRCGICVSDNPDECYHTTVEYGPCVTDESFKADGCKYRTFAKDYEINNRGTKDEHASISNDQKQHHQKEYHQWLPIKNLKEQKKEWRPCEYFDQLNIALASSHSIFNYSIFLALVSHNKSFHERDLLILDEGHLLETEIVKFRGLAISKRRWRKYIGNFEITDYGYDSIERWVDFLIELESKMLGLIGNRSLAESLMVERNNKFNYGEGKISSNKEGNKEIRKKVVSASDLFDSDEEIAKKYDNESKVTNKLTNLSSELSVDIIKDTERLTRTINSILSNPKNWIVSEIKKEDYKVIRVEFKPLDIAPYCKFVFAKASKTLIMSATILNHKTFCRSVGLNPDEVKYIQIQSDFPIKNRPIRPLDIAYLNYSNMQSGDVISRIAKAVDNLMFVHKSDKGIIHTSSYEQLRFIKENISQENARRLLVTDPEIQRDEVLFQHMSTPKPTVLISPSLHTGLDLRNNLSRFQIITKVPFPNKSDRWINAKRKEDEEWYYWQTALKLIQAYGRSVRSEEDWAKTYVLDSAFGYFVKKNQDILPRWFINAIKSRNK